LKLREEFYLYKSLKQKALLNRTKFLEGLAFAQSQVNNIPAENILKQLVLRGQQRAMSRKVKSVKGMYRVGVTVIEAPSGPDSNWETITEKEDIEDACMHKNI
jgi:hypothetical protein